MISRNCIRNGFCWALAILVLQGCATTTGADSAALSNQTATGMPSAFSDSGTGSSSANVAWRDLFSDPYLTALIDTALENNQELNILLQEIDIAGNEARARSSEYLPFVDLRAGAGTEKVGQYTRDGAVEENLPLKEGEAFPEPLPDFAVAADMSWEIDIWNKLRNAKKAAVLRYLATREGRNFMTTHLVAEIAESYYELLALDNLRTILEQMIEIQTQAYEAVKLQKAAARATELAVRRFEAEVLKNNSELFVTQQRITETENRINFLLGRYPQPVARNPQNFETRALRDIAVGTPDELLANRPDIRQAELELSAAELDVAVARARFYPSLELSAAVGFQSAEGGLLFSSPESLLYNVAGELVMPVFNRRGIQAAYDTATASQLQALYRYQQTILKAFIEVQNQQAMIRNLGDSHAKKSDQVDALTASVTIANSLFKSARADYTEVLLTQRDALESRMELVELRQQQLSAIVRMYQALGGGYDHEAVTGEENDADAAADSASAQASAPRSNHRS